MSNGPKNIEDLVRDWTPRLRREFLAAVYAIRSNAQVDVIVKMLEQHDVEGALRAVNLDPTQFRGLDKAIGDAFEVGGRLTTDLLPPLAEPSGHRLRISFDARNPRAEALLRESSSTMIVQIVDDQRQAIRQHLEAGMKAGDNPRTVALDLVGRISPETGRREGGVIGLTASQEEWVRRYSAEVAVGDPAALTRNLRDKRFDKTVQAAAKSGKPVPAATQAKMVAAYRSRALKYRGDTIGRTEAITAVHQGQQEAMTQGVEKGQVARQNVRKIWHSASDDRVRETHRVLNRSSVMFDEPFVSPSGARLMFPGDPAAPAAEIINCRCWCQYRVDFFAGVA